MRRGSGARRQPRAISAFLCHRRFAASPDGREDHSITAIFTVVVILPPPSMTMVGIALECGYRADAAQLPRVVTGSSAGWALARGMARLKGECDSRRATSSRRSPPPVEGPAQHEGSHRGYCRSRRLPGAAADPRPVLTCADCVVATAFCWHARMSPTSLARARHATRSGIDSRSVQPRPTALQSDRDPAACQLGGGAGLHRVVARRADRYITTDIPVSLAVGLYAGVWLHACSR